MVILSSSQLPKAPSSQTLKFPRPTTWDVPSGGLATINSVNVWKVIVMFSSPAVLCQRLSPLRWPWTPGGAARAHRWPTGAQVHTGWERAVGRKWWRMFLNLSIFKNGGLQLQEVPSQLCWLGNFGSWSPSFLKLKSILLKLGPSFLNLKSTLLKLELHKCEVHSS